MSVKPSPTEQLSCRVVTVPCHASKRPRLRRRARCLCCWNWHAWLTDRRMVRVFSIGPGSMFPESKPRPSRPRVERWRGRSGEELQGPAAAVVSDQDVTRLVVVASPVSSDGAPRLRSGERAVRPRPSLRNAGARFWIEVRGADCSPSACCIGVFRYICPVTLSHSGSRPVVRLPNVRLFRLASWICLHVVRLSAFQRHRGVAWAAVRRLAALHDAVVPTRLRLAG